MSAGERLEELLRHPQTHERAQRWLKALHQGSPDEGWDLSALNAAQPHVDPLIEPLEWSDLQVTGEGKMLGVLSAVSEEGERWCLRAFSGQLQGAWRRVGWAPPLFEPSAVAQASWETQTTLHTLNRLIEEGRGDLAELRRARRASSQALTQTLIESYTLTRRSGGELERIALSALWPGAPLGAGDCCAPKLLCWAASLGLRPVGLVEFWWGAARGSHQQGVTYAPCHERCAPLLPWLLGER